MSERKRARLTEVLRLASPLAVPALLVLGIVMAALLFASPSMQRTVTTGLINLVIVLGLYMFIGNSGVLSFGHIGFAAIGAYTSAIVTIPDRLKSVLLPDLPGFLANLHVGSATGAILGGLVATAVAVAVGVPILRMNPISIPISLLSLLVIVNVVASNWDQVTRGTGSMIGIPTDTTMTVASIWALLTMAAAYALKQTRVGLRLRASRDDEPAARAVGIDIWRDRVIAFSVSAFFVAIGGHLIAHQLGSIAPAAFYFNLTFITLAMLVIGGKNSVAGAVIGTVTVSVLAEVLRHAERGIEIGGVGFGATPGLREVGVALVMLGCLVFRPAGLTGGREIVWPRRRRANGQLADDPHYLVDATT